MSKISFRVEATLNLKLFVGFKICFVRCFIVCSNAGRYKFFRQKFHPNHYSIFHPNHYSMSILIFSTATGKLVGKVK